MITITRLFDLTRFIQHRFMHNRFNIRQFIGSRFWFIRVSNVYTNNHVLNIWTFTAPRTSDTDSVRF